MPFRTNVLLQPTTDCLVHLTDMPFTVITLSEVEVCHFERVQHGLKQFDLVFVFTDFSRPPLHINSIPFGLLEAIKEWLDSVDIPISEGAVNLTWSAIMKTVNEDPFAFFDEGGWAFLGGNSDVSGSWPVVCILCLVPRLTRPSFPPCSSSGRGIRRVRVCVRVRGRLRCRRRCGLIRGVVLGRE